MKNYNDLVAKAQKALDHKGIEVFVHTCPENGVTYLVGRRKGAPKHQGHYEELNVVPHDFILQCFLLHF